MIKKASQWGHIYISRSNNFLVNQSAEAWLFQHGDPNIKHLFLWRNNPVVVIGRHQNPYRECHLNRLEEDGVVLARRESGGGAVYQDLGNTNFTFYHDHQASTKEDNNSIICKAIHDRYDLDIQPKGRNDLVVNDKKVSGAAYRLLTPKFLHHGTLLRDVQMERLQNYLNPDKAKLESKGVQSVQARVLNMKELNPDITHEGLCESIVDSFLAHFCDRLGESKENCRIEYVDEEGLQGKEGFQASYDKYKDWDWRYGRSPEFTYHVENRFSWGNLDIHFNSKSGVIRSISIFSDSLYPSMITAMETHLSNCELASQPLADAFSKMKREFEGEDAAPPLAYLDEAHAWFSQQL